jgi:hypothetical protein
MVRLLTRREVAFWMLAFVMVSALLVLTGFASDDPDSALYANLSARLADGPAHRWIAPEWWGYWDSEGLFREHPAGIFLLPAALGALGLPAVQGAYVVGIATALACLVVLCHLITRVSSGEDGRLALVLLQLMPVAFIFRIRANHEYPMLLSLLVLLVASDGVRRSWAWLPVPAIALVAALLVKGVFVVIPLLAVVLWISMNPLGTQGSAWRPTLACTLAVLTMGVAVWLYEWGYLAATGESFWRVYWARQLEPLTLATPIEGHTALLARLWFYLLRLLWHPAPWSFALIVAAWKTRGSIRHTVARLPGPARRALIFATVFALVTIALFVPASRFAERYPFSAHYAIAAAGVVVALHRWPSLRRIVVQADRQIPGLPALVWTLLMLLRLAIGSLLPRISA